MSFKENREAFKAYNENNKMFVDALEMTGQANGIKWSDLQRYMVIPAGLFKTPYIIKYNDLQAVRIVNETKEITTQTTQHKRKGVIKRSLIGGVLFSAPGAIIGGLTSKKNETTHATTNQVTTSFIVITRNDIYNPVLKLPYNDAVYYKLQEIIQDK